jgi:hypothetical protein
MPTYKEDLHLGHKLPVMQTDDIDQYAVTSDKIMPGGVHLTQLGDDVKQLMTSVRGYSAVASAKVIEVGVQSQITIVATCLTPCDSIIINRGGIVVAQGSGTELEFTDTITPISSDVINYLVTFNINGQNKEALVTVSPVYPIYYGSGSEYADADTKAPIKASPAGKYEVTIENTSDHVVFCIPANMEFGNAYMNGILFPFNTPIDVLRNNTPYKFYVSEYAYEAGTINLVIS